MSQGARKAVRRCFGIIFDGDSALAEGGAGYLCFGGVLGAGMATA